MLENDLVFGLSFAGQHLRSSTVGQDHGDENLLCMVQQAGRQRRGAHRTGGAKLSSFFGSVPLLC